MSKTSPLFVLALTGLGALAVACGSSDANDDDAGSAAGGGQAQAGHAGGATANGGAKSSDGSGGGSSSGDACPEYVACRQDQYTKAGASDMGACQKTVDSATTGATGDQKTQVCEQAVKAYQAQGLCE